MKLIGGRRTLRPPPPPGRPLMAMEDSVGGEGWTDVKIRPGSCSVLVDCRRVDLAGFVEPSHGLVCEMRSSNWGWEGCCWGLDWRDGRRAGTEGYREPTLNTHDTQGTFASMSCMSDAVGLACASLLGAEYAQSDM